MAEQLLGYSPEEVVGIKPFDFACDPHELQSSAQALGKQLGISSASPVELLQQAALQSDGAYRGQWVFIHREGHRIPVMLSCSAVRQKGGQILGYLVVARDMSLELQNQIMAERLAMIAGHIPGVLFQLKVSGQDDIEFLYISEGAERLVAA